MPVISDDEQTFYLDQIDQDIIVFVHRSGLDHIFGFA
jgi:hypothetical protein